MPPLPPAVRPSNRVRVPVEDYDLDATLASGQAFGWTLTPDGSWEGVVGGHAIRVRAVPGGIEAEAHPPPADWGWLRHYFQTDVRLEEILATFPQDGPMQASVQGCRGLRLLRQDPWQCLASFILSSTKQIVQIQQICRLLSLRYGEPVRPPWATQGPLHTFPCAERLARCTERELRECKMGFRAPGLLDAARRVALGELDLGRLGTLPLSEARDELCKIRGVGPKIANCVLLFACGFPTAFPVDVWVRRAVRELYFPRRRPTEARLQRFVETHFGPHAGYAQQYLFHHRRAVAARNLPPAS